jgi:hypothetical protein
MTDAVKAKHPYSAPVLIDCGSLAERTKMFANPADPDAIHFGSGITLTASTIPGLMVASIDV